MNARGRHAVRPYGKRTENFTFSVLLHTYCKIGELHLLGVLSGGNEPSLCKGRWLAKQDGGIVKSKISPKNNSSAAFGDMLPADALCASATQRSLSLCSSMPCQFSRQALLLWTQRRSHARGKDANILNYILPMLCQRFNLIFDKVKFHVIK